jgi:hypothetical protein
MGLTTTSTAPPGGDPLCIGSRHFVPTSCLATISLSLRDKANLPSKGHTIILAFMGLQPRAMHLALRAVGFGVSSSHATEASSGSDGASPYQRRGEEVKLEFQDGIETNRPLMAAGVLVERRGVVQ